MGSRTLDKVLFDMIIESGHESVSFVGPNERQYLVWKVAGVGIDVDFIDSDPKFDNPRDAVYDDVEFAPLIVCFNCEKHYPIGQKVEADFILVGDNDEHNGDCNPIDSFEKLVKQNKLHTVWKMEKVEKWWVVGGTNAD